MNAAARMSSYSRQVKSQRDERDVLGVLDHEDGSTRRRRRSPAAEVGALVVPPRRSWVSPTLLSHEASSVVCGAAGHPLGDLRACRISGTRNTGGNDRVQRTSSTDATRRTGPPHILRRRWRHRGGVEIKRSPDRMRRDHPDPKSASNSVLRRQSPSIARTQGV
jgi:hypothetical protein